MSVPLVIVIIVALVIVCIGLCVTLFFRWKEIHMQKYFASNGLQILDHQQTANANGNKNNFISDTIRTGQAFGNPAAIAVQDPNFNVTSPTTFLPRVKIVPPQQLIASKMQQNDANAGLRRIYDSPPEENLKPQQKNPKNIHFQSCQHNHYNPPSYGNNIQSECRQVNFGLGCENYMPDRFQNNYRISY